MPRKKSSKKKKASSKEHPLAKSFLMEEQEQFHKDHPNAYMLISVFMLLFVVLTFTYVYKFLMMQ